MGRTKKINLLLSLAMALIAALSCLFAVFSWKNDKKITATAETIEPIEYQDLLGIEDRTSWGADAGEYYFGGVTLDPFGYFNTAASVSQCWYVGNDAVIAANNGVDIMQYIYINDKSARELITANYNGDKLANSCGCWLSNPAASPVYVETTTGSGIIIRILKAYSGDTFTFTFKKGFSLIRADGETIYVSGDITYNIENGVLSKVQMYTATFNDANGDMVYTNRFANGATFGELPEIPAKDGYEGVWQIDGEDITADSVYTYTANKTATIVYKKNISDTLETDNWGTAGGADCTYIRIGNRRESGNLMMSTAFGDIHWQDHASTAAENYGCDLMEYIYVNGKSARAISNENGTSREYGGEGKTSTFPFSMGGIYAPIDVHTAGANFYVLVMTDYVASADLEITFKAGFKMATSDGAMLYTDRDVSFKFISGVWGKVQSYTLSFECSEGTVAPIAVTAGAEISNLPEVPKKDGYTGVWQIEGAEITASTVYNYGADKTAVAVYTEVVTGTDISDALVINDWGDAETDGNTYFRIQLNNEDIKTTGFASCWNDNGTANAEKNTGCDIMEYIHINGESVRSIVTKNDTDRTYAGSTAPSSWGGLFAPVLVYTFEDCFAVKVLTSYAARGTFRLTFKEGFTLKNAAGELLTLSKDVDLMYLLTYSEISSDYVLPNTQLTEPETPTKESEEYNYIFKGWYVADVSTGEVSDRKWDFNNDRVTGALTLTAVFDEVEKTKYTVTFDCQNGTKNKVNVYEGSYIKESQIPATPTKETTSSYKYVFEGWYLDGELYDFTANEPITEDITLIAKYQAIHTITISDLYREEEAGTADFADGQIETSNDGTQYVGYNGNEAFLLQFDIKFDEEPTVHSTFGIKMIKQGATLIPASSEFYLGWHIYFYRPAAPSYITLISSNGAATGDGRNTMKFWDWDVNTPTLTAGTSYTVKLGYRLLDAEKGTVELYTNFAGFERTEIQELGAEYVANAAMFDRLYFYVEGAANEVLKFSDCGYMDQPAYSATFNDGTTEEIINGRHFVLPEKTQEGKAFVGWTTSATFDPATSPLYPAGYDMPASEGLKLYAVWIDFALQEGAAVKGGVGNGIRFLADINATTYTAWANSGLVTGAGTLIVPTDYLKKVPFVHSSFPTGYYNDVKLEKWALQEGTTWTYTAALVNIPQTLYARSLSARGYLQVKYTDGSTGYVYTPYDEAQNARSMYQVAAAAYQDTEKNYKNLVAIYVNGVADLALDGNFDVTLSDTAKAIGEYTITTEKTGASLAITLTKKDTAATQTDISISSALINGTRVAIGYTGTIEINGLYWDVKNNSQIGGDAVSIMLTPSNNGDKKDSADFVYYDSSDEDLNFFLNDFTKRHSGYMENNVNQKVNSTIAGVSSEEFFSHEWNSLAYYWYDAVGSNDGYTEDRASGLRDFLSRVPVDDYGYVWQSNDNVRPNDSTPASGEHRMGWPFPNSENTAYSLTETSKGGWFDLITYTHNYAGNYATSWDFNDSDDGGWTSSGVTASVSDNLFVGTASNATGSITFTSPTLPGSYNGGCTDQTNKTCTHSNISVINAYYAPLLELDIRIADASNVEDIKVHYTSTKGTGTVSVNEKAFIAYPYSGAYNHIIFLPMYAEENWGADISTYITQIQVEVVLKGTMSGNVGLNYVRCAFDTRHSNNNSILISSLRQDYDFTGDLDYLKANITRARKALNFLMQMYDVERGLNRQSYLPGHDGKKAGASTLENTVTSLSNGYWDITFMPEYDFQSNMYFYKAVADMAYLEKVLEDNGNTVDKTNATVKTATRELSHGTSVYNYTSGELESLANTIKTAIQKDASNGGFWNDSTGRFVAGYTDSQIYDYGHVAWNLEAIYYGIASEEQAGSIMAWLEGETNLYKYEFAPKVNTVQDAEMLTGLYEGKDNSWLNCQFGGAIMYTSFYDLMARINVLGADNAYDRLTAIEAWYKGIYEFYVAGEHTPDDFYWDYYFDDTYDGEYALQNGMKGMAERDGQTNGVLGIDGEFLESYLLVSAVPYGFFGLDANGKTLKVAPALPTALSHFSIENLAFNNVKYDLKVFKKAVQISAVRGATDGLKVEVALDYAAGEAVYVNGVQTNNYTVENGKVYVTVDFGAAIVEVR